MSRTNAYLLNSLMWNLREMTILIKQMRNRIGDTACYSWRHPLKNCGELDVLQLLEDNKECDRYTYLLELTFDRLVYSLNLIVKYLESCDALAKFKPGKNVERPKNLSMASLLYMIWDRIQVRCDTAMDVSKMIHYKSSTSSSYTQSDVTSISSCSTCELAQKLVTQIVLKLEEYFVDDADASALFNERKAMKKKLTSSSNWSVMMSWMNAVLKDISTMCEDMQKFKLDNKKLRSRLDSDDSSFTCKIKKYEEEMKILQRICRESDERSRCLENEIRALRDEKQKQQEDMNELKSLNSEYRKQLSEVEAKKTCLEEKIVKRDKMEQKKAAEWKAKLDEVEKKRESIENEMEGMRSSIEDLGGQVSKSDSRCAALQIKLNQAMDKIKSLKDENAKLLVSLDEKQKDIDKFSNKLLEAFPDLSENSKNSYKATGDPLTDMKHQIEANKLRINQLTLCNENLLKTVSKIETLQKQRTDEGISRNDI